MLIVIAAMLRLGWPSPGLATLIAGCRFCNPRPEGSVKEANGGGRASTNSRSRRRSRSSAPEANARRPRRVSSSARRGFSPPEHPSRPRRSPTGPMWPNGRCRRARPYGSRTPVSPPASPSRRPLRPRPASPKTTKLYDRTADTVTVDEIKRLPNRWTCSATPCGPLASTTRSTSTTTSSPASATTGAICSRSSASTCCCTAARRTGPAAHRGTRGRGSCESWSTSRPDGVPRGRSG